MLTNEIVCFGMTSLKGYILDGYRWNVKNSEWNICYILENTWRWLLWW